MRYLAIGDIHGYAQALKQLLTLADLRPDDQVLTLGDYVDRGPNSRDVLDQLIALHRRGQLVALRGNHDVMMLEARTSTDMRREWLRCGGKATLASYAGGLDGGGSLADVPAEHWAFLEEACVDWHEIDTHFFVHANAYADLPLEEQPAFMLHWEPVFEALPHCSGKVMVCGHTKQASGLPRNWGHAVCLDTWVYGDGWLTCLDVKSGRLWQVNRNGASRALWLPEPEPAPHGLE
jgi:serine/threonine protein phosphatase 1